MQAWRAKSKQHREQFESTMTLSGAIINNAQTLGQLAVQRAFDRVKAAAAARRATATQAVDGVDLSA